MLTHRSTCNDSIRRASEKTGYFRSALRKGLMVVNSNGGVRRTDRLFAWHVWHCCACTMLNETGYAATPTDYMPARDAGIKSTNHCTIKYAAATRVAAKRGHTAFWDCLLKPATDIEPGFYAAQLKRENRGESPCVGTDFVSNGWTTQQARILQRPVRPENSRLREH